VAVLGRILLTAILCTSLTACGSGKVGNLFGKKPSKDPVETVTVGGDFDNPNRETVWDLFNNKQDPNVTVAVNRYIWNASLDILSFLPVEAADPFSGVIVMGWGRAKGSSQTYRATVYIKDPALDARSLKVSLMSRSGPANRDTVRAIEDAILTRARQLRIAESKL